MDCAMRMRTIASAVISTRRKGEGRVRGRRDLCWSCTTRSLGSPGGDEDEGMRDEHEGWWMGDEEEGREGGARGMREGEEGGGGGGRVGEGGGREEGMREEGGGRGDEGRA